MDYKEIIDKLVKELSFRVGVPNIHNKEHQSIMSEILSEWGEYEVKDTIFEFLTEIDDDTEVTYQNKKGETKKTTYKNAIAADKESPQYKAADALRNKNKTKVDEPKKKDASKVSAKDFADRPDQKKKKKEDGEEESKEGNISSSQSEEEKKEFNNSLDTSISDIREKRKTGIAGAGGAAASYGESIYADNVSSLNFDEFQKENESDIKKEIEIINSKKLNVEQKLVLENMGYTIVPPDEDGIKYLATRKVYFNQKLEEAKNYKDHVFHKDPGFKKNIKSFESWCNAAFDGGVATREMIQEGNEIDTSKPFNCVQSDTEVDKKVKAELEKRRDNSTSDEERKHYERELYFFEKSGKYHDTYVVGENTSGQMTVVSVTNKAASNLKDPHNNTTPAARLNVLKDRYDEKTQKVVIDVLQKGIDRVSNVTEDTKKNSAKIEIDENFGKLARIAAPKRFKDIDRRGSNRKKTKAGGPARGAEFGHYLDEEGISVEKWESMNDIEKLQTVQKFNASNDVTYDPFAKVFIKVGEVDTGGHAKLLAVRAEAEKQGVNLNASNLKECGDIKRNEQGAVKETHENVVNTIYDEDKKEGFPKTDENGNVVENGPTAKAYIDTVLDALHFTSYIDFEDKDDDKLIAQMGIRGAKPSDIRNCLGDLSGYGDIPPGTRQGLKEYLRNTSTINAETGAIIIKSKKDGQETQLAEDTWRTAGTSQKVASAFGKDMQNCVGSKVDNRRSSK